MITAVRGALEAAGPDWVVVQVGGVSLKAHVPASAVQGFGPVGSQVRLHTYLAVRDDGLALYGLPTAEGLHLFELLMGVGGVGPRHALAVLSELGPEGLATAIAAEDTGAISRAPGVGKKTAARIVLELKGRIEREWGAVPSPAPVPGDEVTAALLALGYTPAEARQAVAGAAQEAADLPLEEQVRLALRRLARW